MYSKAQTDIRSLTRAELGDRLTAAGFPAYAAAEIFRWIYRKRVEDFGRMTNISRPHRAHLADNYYFSTLEKARRFRSADGTEKYLFRLADGPAIETVLIPEGKRRTLCVSSQVGCRFACRFCCSGRSGWKRDLTAGEIVGQVLSAESPATNLVFMGMGEPLDNLDRVLKAIEIISDPAGIGLGRRKICLSTCGLVQPLKKLIALSPSFKIALSLHSTDEKVRAGLMPVSGKNPLSQLVQVLESWTRKNPGALTLEYLMLAGTNTAPEDAHRLSRLARRLRAKVNLIPCHATGSGFDPPPPVEQRHFRDELVGRGIFATLRRSRGEDISAACGQLGLSALKPS